MCLREVVTMDKNRGYKAYNKFVSELLVDESIREEVITKISSFLKYGNVCFEGNNLFGKCFVVLDICINFAPSLSLAYIPIGQEAGRTHT